MHRIGYAINDLKNGNLMMSRRGQLKGIDLDSYASVHSPRDKVTDFMFLAVSLILLIFSVPVANRGPHMSWEALIESEAQLRSGLAEAWPFGDVEAFSAGRVTRDELTQVIVDLVHRSRHLTYTKRPDLYSDDVGRLISIKTRGCLSSQGDGDPSQQESAVPRPMAPRLIQTSYAENHLGKLPSEYTPS